MRTFEHPHVDDLTIGAVLAALADPYRRQVVRQLADEADELTCSQFDLAVGKSTRTHHFRVLREAGIIRQHYEGTTIHNALRADDVGSRFPGLLDSVIEAERAALASTR
ncbi:DNA-binding transcriptional ArsR family regulator [Diaminobutyricimonas aerilata]|uniref:DNA-binding transcriptional ArsR family regulator n=1 Tax=Diaminobutyricimonas aerilata TaxID=1162967 RepID=A0A2M9CNC4_9MICO|nr:helix-turn-helix domain-containing protein [Diaminobutyricimonas aerilata]PJJ73401.1 DNA-binding transcriptional ArsR family regulator [Diaminobutyricimonas aerilata]